MQSFILEIFLEIPVPAPLTAATTPEVFGVGEWNSPLAPKTAEERKRRVITCTPFWLF